MPVPLPHPNPNWHEFQSKNLSSVLSFVISKVRMIILIKLFDFACHSEAPLLRIRL